MKKRNRGFTLIELLAVIVILAVIALIAVPIIMNVINDSKKGAAKDSMYSYVKAVELGATQQLKADTDLLSGTYTAKDGNLYNGATKVLGVELKGTKPKDGGSITLNKGQVTGSDLTIDGYCINYDGKESTVKDNCGVVQTTDYTEGDVIYYNPETNKKCASGEVNIATNAKTGCLKWNVITMGDTASKTTIDIMLDHNSTATVAWNSDGKNIGGMKEVATALQSDVASWNISIKGTARLITGQEVADIARNIVWTACDSSISITDQPWLYQNTKDNGDDTNWGYWTSTAYSASDYLSWNVQYSGTLKSYLVGHFDKYGVRPVITISKSVIS